MPTQASRRTFLTLAGASLGLLATGAGEAQAERRGSGPELRREVPNPPYRTLQATIVGFSGAELEVQADDSGQMYILEARDFGDWEHQIGDRVVVTEDSRGGGRLVKPYVTTVNAPLPRRSRLEIGSEIKIGEHTARIASESVIRQLEALRARSPRLIHWLLIENVRSGELRVFGVIDRQ